MIAFFPEIYHDELLYSQIARYNSRSGYARYTYTSADIYNNEKLVRPSIEFVNRYTSDAMEWMTKDKPWEEVVAEHTMYPAYIRFLPKQRRADAVNGILTCEGNWKNLMCLPLQKNKRYIRYCPVCAKEDRKIYGETYWHREHQIPRIDICTKHKCYLENSIIETSSKTSPGLYDAEGYVPEEYEIRICDNERLIDFNRYVIDVFRKPIDLNNFLPIGIYLHSRLDCDYINSSGLVRNITKLYKDYRDFYGDEITTMPQSYMQKIFNGYIFDTYFILQLAYFEGISVNEITQLPNDTSLFGIDSLYKELSDKYNVDFCIVKEIGDTALKHSYNQNRVAKKSGVREARYNELDEKYLPQVKDIVEEIVNKQGRPEKLSFAKVTKALSLPQKQINKLPKCKEYIEQYIETQPQFWARQVEWAYKEMQNNDNPINFTRIMKLTNMRLKDIKCCSTYIKNEKVKLAIYELFLEKVN